MSTGDQTLGTAKAAPTKDFFVNMLTRDIELGDALLDLLDNCLDGVLRSPKSDDPLKPYKGYRATMTLSPEGFVIEDNCGGIPLEVAKRYAFAMGRPSDVQDAAGSTIGMYGIGMKRAIFKMGGQATVESQHGEEEGFSVEFTPQWMADDNWDDLPIRRSTLDTSHLSGGTRIEVKQLNSATRAFFSNESLIDSFRRTVSRHYALILQKGFEVIIGSAEEIAAKSDVTKVHPENFELLTTVGTGGVQPIIYRGSIDGVKCEIYAGLYRPLLSPDELEREEEKRGTSDGAGWTVACNDRVVVWKDKTRLTGWGEAGVPNFHGQFIPVTGIVLLSAEDPKLLPLTTTKRGLDAASNVYSRVKDLMRDATKDLTRFTNKWKAFPDGRDEVYRQSQLASLEELRDYVESDGERKFTALRSSSGSGMISYRPKLPIPAQAKTDVRVSFLARKEDVDRAGRRLFDDADFKPEDVGREALGRLLKEISDEEM